MGLELQHDKTQYMVLCVIENIICGCKNKQ